MVVNRTLMIAAGVAAAGLAFYVYGKAKGGTGGFYQTIGEGVGGAAVDLVDGAVTGVAVGIGDRIGVPRTEKTKCQAAKDAGSRWEASLYCPAGEFLGYVWDSL